MFVADDKEKIVDRVSKTKMEGKLLLWFNSSVDAGMNLNNQSKENGE